MLKSFDRVGKKIILKLNMKTVNLNAYGVEEMSNEQMSEINGGIAPIIIVGLVVAGLLCCQNAK